MNPLPEVTIQCPCCWERIEVVVDTTAGDQVYTEDCSVCCRPLLLTVQVRNGEVVSIGVRHEDD